MRRLIVILALLIAGSASAGSLDELADWMTGSFASTEQAAADTSYYDIRLEMHRIWPDRTDGVWLYVEQAVSIHLDKPYRQRVYHVEQLEDDLFKSAVFALPDPEAAVGAWEQDELLADVDPHDLELRDGCAVFLRWDDSGAYRGSTIGRGCTSTLRSTAYATSFVTVLPGRIESWDQGFGADGAQVWGAELGGYVFLKQPR